MKNLGLILIFIGALAIILCAFVPQMSDLANQNWYTFGSAGVVIIGLITHIIVNKRGS